jgi:guanylate kinase
MFSVSTTTRSLRGSEKDGSDYFFVSREEFEKRIEKGFFLEWAEVHGHLYGTSEEWVKGQIAEGRSVILDIDVQGALQVKDAFPESVLIFILPASPEVLNDRLINRSTDDSEIILERMRAAAWETGWIGAFDYFVRNDRLEDSVKQVENILQGEGNRLVNMPFPDEARVFEPDSFLGREYWKNRRIIVTSGPTREPLDDVRFISNRSCGLMGSSMAEAFRDAGSDVFFVTGSTCNMNPPGVSTVNITTASDMLAVLSNEVGKADLLVMAAAVSDFKPASYMHGKMERAGECELQLKATPDILSTLNKTVERMCPVLAFALEFGEDFEENALKKMRRKGACAVFINRGDISGIGMEETGNEGIIFFEDSSSLMIHRCSKRYAAELVVAAMGRYMMKRTGGE